MEQIRIKSYGKVNLSLDVCGVRDDGYHLLRSIMQKIALHDYVDVSWTETDGEEILINLSCNKHYLPTDERNLAYKAAQMMIDKFGHQVGGGIIDIDIEKHLPVAAGLAGGSGNGAALIVALNRLWGLKLDTKQMCALGKPLGADVPFCLLIQNTGYGCALCEGTGTELTPLKSRFKRAVLLVKPNFGVSTKEVYKGIDQCEITERPDTEALVSALSANDGQVVYDNMINVLEEYTLANYQEVKILKEKVAAETTAAKVLMTGSGPTVFALFDKLSHAQKACRKFRKEGYEAYWTTTL